MADQPWNSASGDFAAQIAENRVRMSEQNPTMRKAGKPGRPKGLPKTGGGSRKGVPNKATANAREAIARFIDGNAERLNGWLDEIEMTDGPKAAFQCFADLLEYHVPKLSRTEMTGPDGGPVKAEIDVNLSPSEAYKRLLGD